VPIRATHRSPAAWLDDVRAEERRGELLAAFDLAERGLSEYPGDVGLEHRAVLALARSGATDEAARRFEEYGLDGAVDEDVSSLRARLAKDAALAATGTERARLAAQAAALYHSIFTRTRGYYPAINAATLWLVAGYAARSRELAGSILELVAGNRGSYYAVATEAEAHLLRGDARAAEAALVRAAATHDGDYGALASTRRQLRLVCDLLGIDPEVLAPLAGPTVVHFCGHRLSGVRFSATREGEVARHVEAAARAARIGYAYGSLASGADILWAEAIMAAGGELHVVLPFARDEFVAWSVRPAGTGWVQRFEHCLAAAASVRYATDDAFLGDDVLFRYGSELAMGLALLRARYLDADVRQLAVWDGGPADGAAGTAIDVATWQRGGNAFTIVSLDGEVTTGPASLPVGSPNGDTVPGPAHASPTRSSRIRPGRVVRALLFGDIRGFSALTDEQLPTFSERFLGTFAEVLARYEDEICHRNTWGDAVYVVLSDAVRAAACALELQEAVSAIDLASLGLPGHLALRLGGHLGPVFPIHDPVVDASAFMGSHVSRTARIEPVTPAGAVYVTEPFAAALVLARCERFTCDYVGHMPLAKNYGRLRMYRLRHG
jgi:Tetratricopeptide Repeats-Sensor/Adenylate and Guanylate cyclase catalytic domain